MNVKELIVEEIERVPEPLLVEILSFIRSLGAKASEEKTGTAIASETALGKDWLRSEEDETWKDL